jgi:hypothetical protein
MNRQLTAVILAVPLLFSCLARAEQTPSARPEMSTGLEGVIWLAPSHPGPIREGVPSAKPFANEEFIIQQGDRTVASFKTDEAGKFRVSLPPGHYTVLRPEPKTGIGRYGPFEADVAADGMTQVEWHCDTGMR